MALSTNTPPTVYGPIIVNVTEGGPAGMVSPSANTIDSDLVDLVRIETVPPVLPPGVTWDATFNAFVIDPSDPAFDSLAAGMATTITLNFNITDGTNTVPHSMILTVTGVNDQAVVSGLSTGAVVEDSAASASGLLGVQDVDAGEAAFVATTTPLLGTYGSLSISAEGAWVYTLDNATLGALNAGQTATDLITVSTVDGTEQVIEITITGADEIVLTGTSASNYLAGNARAETILGLGGRDTLLGNAGNDSLDGGSGNDNLTGGAGLDVLTGGSGADRFIFTKLDDSRTGSADRITDFLHGTDSVDLKGIDAVSGGGDNAFKFIGGAGFTKAGQLRYDAASGMLEADVNGDKVADLQVQMTPGLTLTQSDFIL